jgi:hypothetical protein
VGAKKATLTCSIGLSVYISFLLTNQTVKKQTNMSKTDNAKHPLDYLEAHTPRLDDACTYARELETRNKEQGVEIAALKAKQQELENTLNEV